MIIGFCSKPHVETRNISLKYCASKLKDEARRCKMTIHLTILTTNWSSNLDDVVLHSERLFAICKQIIANMPRQKAHLSNSRDIFVRWECNLKLDPDSDADISILLNSDFLSLETSTHSSRLSFNFYSLQNLA